MSEKRTSLEIIAPTVEEAIQQGLLELGVPSSNVDIDILDEGSRGLFGIGARQARIRLTLKETEPQPQPAPPKIVKDTEKIPTVIKENKTEENQHILAQAEEVVRTLLQEMQIKASVSASFLENSGEHEFAPIYIDIRGKDLTILIGPQAETLNALQYISGLILGKKINQPVSIMIDVEGYRSRRENQLRHLARRMAEQAIKTGRRQILEPMPANERRIIHLELKDFPGVTTESVGMEPRRKVTIIPK
ncbi:MAG: RNA-binding cell elongation regulator Jag/EloR [Anaerolineales bacterium]